MVLSSSSGTLQEDSYCAGAGARPILKKALEHKGSKTDAEMLTALHSYLKPKLEPPPGKVPENSNPKRVEGEACPAPVLRVSPLATAWLQNKN